MLKRRVSPYGVGRKRGDWWKWKIDPYTIDAVLIYAQPGSGRRASLLTDYTFGVWDEGELVPDRQGLLGPLERRDRRARPLDPPSHARALRAGPACRADARLRARVRRHRPLDAPRAGIAVRFPRMLRWRRDKKPEDADTLDTVRRLLEGVEARVRPGSDRGQTPT